MNPVSLSETGHFGDKHRKAFLGVSGHHGMDCDAASYLGPVGSCWWVMSSLEASLLLHSLVAAADRGACRASLFDWMK